MILPISHHTHQADQTTPYSEIVPVFPVCFHVDFLIITLKNTPSEKNDGFCHIDREVEC